MKRTLMFLCMLSCVLGSVSGTINYNVPNITSAPSIDGVVEPGEWDQMLLIDRFYQVAPGYNVEPTEKTEMRLGYDDKNIYLLAVCHMEDPSQIRLFHCRRDQINVTDRVAIYLDTFASNYRAYFFTANAYGEQGDGMLGDGYAYDMQYESKGSVNDEGYVIEMAIPFKSIKYKSGKDVEWNVMLQRAIVNKNELMQPFPDNREAMSTYDSFGTLTFEKMPSRQRLKLIPAFIMTETRTSVKSESDGGWNRSEDDEMNMELNLFYEPNASISTTFTYNPDFSTIEADALEIDVNNRNPLYRTEKRPFFLEDNNPYDAPINIYYTRRINDPEWGAKISGITPSGSYYGLAAKEDDMDIYYGFAAYTRRLDARDSKIRAAVAVKNYDSSYNTVIDLDTNLTLNDRFRMTLQGVYSMTDPDEKKGNAYFGRLEYGSEHVYAAASARGLSEDFRAQLGFIDVPGKRYYDTHAHYATYTESIPFLRRIETGLNNDLEYDYDHSHMTDWSGGVYFDLSFDNNISLSFGREEFYTCYEDTGKDFNYGRNWVYAEFTTFDFLTGHVHVQKGKQSFHYFQTVDDYSRYSAGLTFRPGPYLDISMNAAYQEIENWYDVTTYELDAKLQFSKNLWISGIVQIEDLEYQYSGDKSRSVNFYPMLVYKSGARTAVYAGIKSNDYEDDFSDISPYEDSELSEKYLFFKISHTFDLM